MELLFVHNLQRLLLRLRLRAGEQAVEAASPAERKRLPPPLQVPGDPDGGGVVGGDVVDDELEVGADGAHELAEEADDPLPPHEGPREHQVLVHAALRDERLHRRQVPPVHAVVERPHHVRRRGRGHCRRRLRPFSCRCGYKNQRRRPCPAAAAREACRSAGETTAGTTSRAGGCGHSKSRAMLERHRPSVHAARPASVGAKNLISSRCYLSRCTDFLSSPSISLYQRIFFAAQILHIQIPVPGVLHLCTCSFTVPWPFLSSIPE